MRKKIIALVICLLLMTTAIVLAEANTSALSKEHMMTSNEYGNPNLSINPTNDAGYTNITVQQAYAFLTNTSNGIQIPIDVRTPSEWAIAHIDTPSPENPQHWPYLQMGQNLSKFIELYKGKEVILYCKAGSRSFIATKLLVENNFTGTIYNMIGGITAWTEAGYPTRPNAPPNTPVISGQNKGKIGQEYQYIFNTTDPEQDDVYYYVNWSDNTTNQLTGPYYSGEEAALNHIWSEKGTYTLKVKARDIYGAESDYAILEVKMPKTSTTVFHQTLWKIFEKHPLFFLLRGI